MTEQPGYYKMLLENVIAKATATGLGMGMVLIRRDKDGEKCPTDIHITFDATQLSGGYAGDRINPPHDPEWEFEITDISFDGAGGKLTKEDECGPLTQHEIDVITKWFEDHRAEAAEEATENLGDQHDDYERERYDD